MSEVMLDLSPSGPHIGATITNVDLAKADEATADAIRGALAKHGVLFFRDQELDPDSLKRFGAFFGNLHRHPLKGMPGHPEVRRLLADENSKHVAGEEWHTDLSCDDIPPMGSILCICTQHLAIWDYYPHVRSGIRVQIDGEAVIGG